MSGRVAILALAPALLSAAETSQTFQIRGKPQTVAFFRSPARSKGSVLFLPGDGGWRGLAVTVAQTISSWGYDVYGFDTKKYLEGFTSQGKTLSTEQVRHDINDVIASIGARGVNKVTLLGWSQGAGMVLLAAQGTPPIPVSGVITMGLPASAVLGWNWTDTLAAAARLDPDEPHFAVEPVLRALWGTGVWMIHGSHDEYTSAAVAERLYAAANQPKRLIEIAGGDHKFEGRRQELFQALQDGLVWAEFNGRTRESGASH